MHGIVKWQISQKDILYKMCNFVVARRIGAATMVLITCSSALHCCPGLRVSHWFKKLKSVLTGRILLILGLPHISIPCGHFSYQLQLGPGAEEKEMRTALLLQMPNEGSIWFPVFKRHVYRRHLPHSWLTDFMVKRQRPHVKALKLLCG